MFFFSPLLTSHIGLFYNKYMKRAYLLSLIIIVLFTAYSDAASLISVNGFRSTSHKSHTRIVVDLNSTVEFAPHRIANPDRFYFDLKNCMLLKQTNNTLSIGDGIVNKARIAQFDKKTVRVVLDLQQSESYYAFLEESPHRLIIDVYAGKNDLGKAKEETTAEQDVKIIRKIVIDAGHGGDDPGAIGPNGLQEKDIVLSVSRKLGGILENQDGIKVIYTRNGDVFIPLNERTEIANNQKADLFISVHANASPRKAARGVETYFLNWTNDAEAMKVAARENKITLKKMEKLQGDLQIILDDLLRKNKNEESMKLASSVQSSIVTTLRDNYSGIEDLGVKFALFYVLVGAEMPSILAEISFISNREEEKRLSDDSYRDKIAEALAIGINSYISKTNLIVKRNGSIIK